MIKKLYPILLLLLFFSCHTPKSGEPSATSMDSTGIREEQKPNVVIERPQDALMQLHLAEQLMKNADFQKAHDKLKMIKKLYSKPFILAKADFLEIKCLIAEKKVSQDSIQKAIRLFRQKWASSQPDLIKELDSIDQ